MNKENHKIPYTALIRAEVNSMDSWIDNLKQEVQRPNPFYCHMAVNSIRLHLERLTMLLDVKDGIKTKTSLPLMWDWRYEHFTWSETHSDWRDKTKEEEAINAIRKIINNNGGGAGSTHV